MHALSHAETSGVPIPANHPPAAETPGPLNPELMLRRLRRVQDYLVASLENADPLDSNLGSVNSGLMAMALRYESMILEALASGVPLESLKQSMEIYLRLTRQLDRFSNLERQWAKRVAEAAGRERLTPPEQDTSQGPILSDESGAGSPGHGVGGR